MPSYPHRIDVLNRGYVELSDPDQDVLGSDLKTVNAARVSFDASSSELTARDEKLINYLGEHEHTSPFRHSALSLRVKCPLFVAAQWRTHMVASALQSELHSFNEASGRYIEMTDDFYMPSSWRSQSKDNKQASGDDLSRSTQTDVAMIAWASFRESYLRYQSLLNKGVAREQARMVLPNGVYTSFMWTASLQAIANFISLRDEAHAQYEIRQYAKAVREIAMEIFPKSLTALLAPPKVSSTQLASLSDQQLIDTLESRGITVRSNIAT